jgi:hypothetical protein
MSVLKKICSGGQTGADQAGLFVGKYLGFQTGGWMPKGWITLDGPRPDFAEMYRLQEHQSPKYPPRTYQNVKDNDATIRLFTKQTSPGEICTLNAINQYGKPHFDIDLKQPNDPEALVEFLLLHKVESLNVAGNAEKTSPGIYVASAKHLFRAMKIYLDKHGF